MSRIIERKEGLKMVIKRRRNERSLEVSEGISDTDGDATPPYSPLSCLQGGTSGESTPALSIQDLGEEPVLEVGHPEQILPRRQPLSGCSGLSVGEDSSRRGEKPVDQADVTVDGTNVDALWAQLWTGADGLYHAQDPNMKLAMYWHLGSAALRLRYGAKLFSTGPSLQDATLEQLREEIRRREMDQACGGAKELDGTIPVAGGQQTAAAPMLKQSDIVRRDSTPSLVSQRSGGQMEGSQNLMTPEDSCSPGPSDPAVPEAELQGDSMLCGVCGRRRQYISRPWCDACRCLMTRLRSKGTWTLDQVKCPNKSHAATQMEAKKCRRCRAWRLYRMTPAVAPVSYPAHQQSYAPAAYSAPVQAPAPQAAAFTAPQPAAFHQNNEDPFYSPILTRLDRVFSELGFTEEPCKERLVCSMYKAPARFSPHSNLVSAEISRDPSELQKPVFESPNVLRYFRYVAAARNGQDAKDCLSLYPNCALLTE
ncbi:hypothetical protein GE061_015879 [Apolygus lucorum]|uniref:Uncharacterized protein n=1 Tax=Apolygus lucorum TaxID=248454 RepID=A0A8S9XMF2_APOLU|nr:hypothetical protein GE061_015879 [Apolygus lucorum]